MKKQQILLSLMTEENDYQLEQAASARRAAVGLPVELQILFANNDTITQSTQILRAIQGEAAQRPDAVIFEPVGGTALPQVARAACNAGIGWGVLNNLPDYFSELRKANRAPVCRAAAAWRQRAVRARTVRTFCGEATNVGDAVGAPFKYSHQRVARELDRRRSGAQRRFVAETYRCQ